MLARLRLWLSRVIISQLVNYNRKRARGTLNAASLIVQGAQLFCWSLTSKPVSEDAACATAEAKVHKPFKPSDPLKPDDH